MGSDAQPRGFGDAADRQAKNFTPISAKRRRRIKASCDKAATQVEDRRVAMTGNAKRVASAAVNLSAECVAIAERERFAIKGHVRRSRETLAKG